MGETSEGSSLEIPFRLKGDVKWVSGLDSSTTCDDVLNSLLKAADATKGRDVADFVLVEQWRGVERPLSCNAKVLKLWLSWGDEQEHVLFVVKRIKSRCHQLKQLKRRNSISSTNSRLSDTPHPAKAMKDRSDGASSKDEDSQQRLEDMMRVIMSQGKIICKELTKLGGTNEQSSSEETVEDKEEKAELRLLSLELARLHALNEELHSAETKCHLLSSNLSQIQLSQQQATPQPPPPELSSLRQRNEAASAAIARNREKLASMEDEFQRKRELLKRLEYDVNVVEKEGRKMGREYEKVLKIEIPEMPEFEAAEVIYSELKELQLEMGNGGVCTRLQQTGSPESGVSSGADESSSSMLVVNEHKRDYYIKEKFGDVVNVSKRNDDDDTSGLSSLHSDEEGDCGDGTLV